MNGISGSNSSMIGMGTSHMNKTSTLGNINNIRNQNQPSNVFPSKNGSKDENGPGMLPNNRSYSVNRALKDITNNVLNSSGAAVIQNQIANVKTKIQTTQNSSKLPSSDNIKQTRTTGLSTSTTEQRVGGAINMSRKPSPSMHSNYQMQTKQANVVPHVSHYTQILHLFSYFI